jgi:restriction system protein
MALPPIKALVLPVLSAIDRGIGRTPDIRTHLAAVLGLTPTELGERLGNGQTVFANSVAFVLRYAGPAGATIKNKDGAYELTDYGRELLALTPDDAAIAIMKGRKRAPLAADAAIPQKVSDSAFPSMTTERRLDEIVAALTRDLHRQLLDAVREMSFTSFEGLIARLLKAMDYGEPSLQRGGAGDEGVDGIVDEDELGLGRVYVQAKKYGAGNNVGPAAVREFVGALTNQGATKGVFVTSSAFTEAARNALPRGNSAARVALIDGPRLVELLVRHNIGVRTSQTIVVKEIDRRGLDPDSVEC